MKVFYCLSFNSAFYLAVLMYVIVKAIRFYLFVFDCLFRPHYSGFNLCTHY